MAKPRMTEVEIRPMLLPVEPPEWTKPIGEVEALDVLFLAVLNAPESSWAPHRKVTEQRQAFGAYRGAPSQEEAAEVAAIEAFMAAYKTHDTEGMKAAALARHESIQRQQALAWIPNTLTFADGASQEASAALLKAIQGRRLQATLWAALLEAKHEEVVDALDEKMRDTIKRGAMAHLNQYRYEFDRAEYIRDNPGRYDEADKADAARTIATYEAALDAATAWGL